MVPDVGALTAARRVAELPELGAIGISKLSSLAGLAPMNKDSGEREGKRKCAPGRRQIRTALFQAAHSGVLYNPVISAHYVHLISKGKERKVALIACAHKLLRILDARVRHDEPWDASRHPAGLAAMAEEERAAIKNGLADLEAGPEELASEQPCKPATKPKTAAKGTRRTTKRAASKPTAKPNAETLVASAPRRRPTRPVEEPKHG